MLFKSPGVALIVASLVAPVASADDDVSSGRRVQDTTSTQAVEVGDKPGHVVGVVEFKGLTFFEGGEIATHVNTATFDLTEGTGTHQGYVVHHFQDDSTSVERYEGEAIAQDGGRATRVVGTYECIGGTGRFAGLKGSGSYRGERIGSLQAGSFVYVDFMSNCAVP